MHQTLRGQSVDVNRGQKTLSMRILKPTRGGAFSISDRVYDLIKQGFVAHIYIGNGEHFTTIDKNTKPFQIEVVPSKFGGMAPWNRYWFMMKGEELE